MIVWNEYIINAVKIIPPDPAFNQNIVDHAGAAAWWGRHVQATSAPHIVDSVVVVNSKHTKDTRTKGRNPDSDQSLNRPVPQEQYYTMVAAVQADRLPAMNVPRDVLDAFDGLTASEDKKRTGAAMLILHHVDQVLRMAGQMSVGVTLPNN